MVYLKRLLNNLNTENIKTTTFVEDFDFFEDLATCGFCLKVGLQEIWFKEGYFTPAHRSNKIEVFPGSAI